MESRFWIDGEEDVWERNGDMWRWKCLGKWTDWADGKHLPLPHWKPVVIELRDIFDG